MKIPRILHYPGSKWSIAEWVIAHMPPHTKYLEPFFGSGAVLFNKTPSPLEIVNDLNGDVVNLFQIIRDRSEELAEKLRWTPYAREEFHFAHDQTNDDIERARRLLVRCWQSIRVKTGSISGWKCRGTSDEVYHIKQWNALSDDVMLVASRLRSVQIENRPALDLIKRYNRSDVLVYIDPPYVLSTRNGKIYEHEMADQEHIDLLDALDKHPGPVLLSGYANQLYESD